MRAGLVDLPPHRGKLLTLALFSWLRPSDVQSVRAKKRQTKIRKGEANDVCS
jgi:hypothetical protein